MVSFRLEASPLSDARTAAEAEVPWTLTRSAVADDDDDNNDEAFVRGGSPSCATHPAHPVYRLDHSPCMMP